MRRRVASHFWTHWLLEKNSRAAPPCTRAISKAMRQGKRSSYGSALKRYFPQTRQLLSQVASSLGLTSRRQRTVRFQPSTAVYEFERQLLGGGGVPDGDTVALGLGPKCVPCRWKPDRRQFLLSSRWRSHFVPLVHSQVCEHICCAAGRQGGQGRIWCAACLGCRRTHRPCACASLALHTCVCVRFVHRTFYLIT